MPTGAVCSAQIVNGSSNSSIMIGFTCDKKDSTSAAYAAADARVYLYVYSSVQETSEVTKNYLKAWRIMPEYYANSKFKLPTATYAAHGLVASSDSEVLLGCKSTNFYLPKKSYFLEGRHEDILENQATSYTIADTDYACHEKTA